MTIGPKRSCNALAVVAAILVLPGCGGESGELSPGEWVNAADDVCIDGTEEVAALAPATTPEEAVRDANARAQTVASVRDGLIALSRPEGVEEADLDLYLGELDADLEVLARAAAAARRGEPYAPLDKSASLVAINIGLADCVAFSDAIAQMAVIQP